MWPHRRQPTRLPHPWDSPGKNTGVGCHFLLQCRKVKSESEVAQSCPTLSDPMDCSLPGFSIHGIFQARVLEWSAIAFSEPNYTSVQRINENYTSHCQRKGLQIYVCVCVCVCVYIYIYIFFFFFFQKSNLRWALKIWVGIRSIANTCLQDKEIHENNSVVYSFCITTNISM